MTDLIFGDLERELTITRRVLEALPPEHYGWKPHEKSMTLGQLALHVADMPEWMRGTLAADTLDVSEAPRSPATLSDRATLLKRFDEHVAAFRSAVAGFDPASYDGTWTMKHGSHVIVSAPRATAFRIWSVNHMIHHRAQLCVYLRLLNVPVPTVYFNTADNEAMTFE